MTLLQLGVSCGNTVGPFVASRAFEIEALGVSVQRPSLFCCHANRNFDYDSELFVRHLSSLARVTAVLGRRQSTICCAYSPVCRDAGVVLFGTLCGPTDANIAGFTPRASNFMSGAPLRPTEAILPHTYLALSRPNVENIRRVIWAESGESSSMQRLCRPADQSAQLAPIAMEPAHVHSTVELHPFPVPPSQSNFEVRPTKGTICPAPTCPASHGIPTAEAHPPHPYHTAAARLRPHIRAARHR